MKSGTSTFKCTGCTRRHSKSPKDQVDQPDKPNDNLTDASTGEPAAAQDDLYVPAGLLRVIDSMTRKMDILTAEFKCLRAENQHLRSEVQQLRKNVVDRLPIPSSPPQLYATTATPTSRVASAASKASFAPPALAHPNNWPSLPRSNLTPLEEPVLLPPPSGSRGGAASLTNDGFTEVKLRRRAKPSTGTAKSDTVQAVARPQRRMALFVSRLRPDTSVADVQALVEPFLDGKSIVCSKMVTRFPSYSSFHLSCDQAVFDAINKPEVWPEGSIFHPFFGQLDHARTYPLETTSDVNVGSA